MSQNAVAQAEHGMERYFFRVSAEDFKKIPGSPITYWLSREVLQAFEKSEFISDHCRTRKGMATGLNDVFVRLWQEVSTRNIGFQLSREEAAETDLRWFPYANGGNYRKWYGNFDDIVNWQDDGRRLKTEEHESGRIRAVNLNLDYIFKSGLSWTSITSGAFSIRKLPSGFLFSSASNAMFGEGELSFYMGLLNSNTHVLLGKALNPTLNANPGDIGKIPLREVATDISAVVELLVNISKNDWDSYETSWNFTSLPLLNIDYRQSALKATCEKLRAHWRETTREMQRLEEENNRIFIDAYGLQGKLTPDVPLEEITLTCNPHYRYRGNRTDEEREALLLQDTMAEFCSYAVGCMFGRYSLDQPGLVLANQGETLEDYLRQVPQPTFRPDEDNVIPLLDADWFADDVTGRFLEFLRLTFGTEHYAENLAFVERGLNVTNKRNYSIRDFFVKEFYDYHVRMYKKRPIYWLFASPKGSFQALVYLHRYRPDTVSVVLRYLREFRGKLAARRQLVELRLTDVSASQGEKTRLTKELEQLRKQILELDDYEHDVLFPLAGQRLEIDLDDGVKANYPKFGKALKKVAGL